MIEVIPAIDLLDGYVVRLKKGVYDDKEIFNISPSTVLEDFKKNKIKRVHIVDLNGARGDKEGSKKNFEIIKTFREQFSFDFELGGGIRNEENILRAFEVGIKDVILGTVAVKDFSFTKKMIEKYKERIIVGVDAIKESGGRNDGQNTKYEVKVSGWEEGTNVNALSFCEKLEGAGCKRIIFTDINTDGMLSGSNLDLFKALRKKLSLFLVSSGGVSSVDDIVSLNEIHVDGVIVGKAYYDKRVNLADLKTLDL